MAFGTFLKGIISGIGNIFKKVFPVAKNVVNTLAPAIGKIGGMIGGKVGSGIQKVASTATSLINGADRLLNGSNNTRSENVKLLGAGGTGQRALVPRLK